MLPVFIKFKGKAFSVVAELTKPKDCQKAVEKIGKKYGRIEGLVNNAGVNDGVGLENGNYAASQKIPITLKTEQ
jgi:L-fucose dehydrogenase